MVILNEHEKQEFESADAARITDTKLNNELNYIMMREAGYKNEYIAYSDKYNKYYILHEKADGMHVYDTMTNINKDNIKIHKGYKELIEQDEKEAEDILQSELYKSLHDAISEFILEDIHAKEQNKEMVDYAARDATKYFYNYVTANNNYEVYVHYTIETDTVKTDEYEKYGYTNSENIVDALISADKKIISDNEQNFIVEYARINNYKTEEIYQNLKQIDEKTEKCFKFCREKAEEYNDTDIFKNQI